MIKRIFIYLAALNLLDGFITYYGLQHSFITEANPIMSGLYEMNPFYFLAVKVILSVLLLLFVVVKQLPKTKLLKGLALTASILYTFTFVIHGMWLFQI